ERLAELHDVQAALAQGRTHRRAGVGLAGLHLQLDVTDNFLCHFNDLRVLAPVRLPIVPGKSRVPASRKPPAPSRKRPPGRRPGTVAAAPGRESRVVYHAQGGPWAA